MSKNTETIKNITEETLKYLCISGDVSVSEKDNSVFVEITNTDAGILIGYKGETLRALQHIIRLLCFANFQEDCPSVIVDIEGYRKQEEEKLKIYVQKVAGIVKQTKQEEELAPMTSYKRRLIHTFVSEIDGVNTESRGEGQERRIVIKPE